MKRKRKVELSIHVPREIAAGLKIVADDYGRTPQEYITEMITSDVLGTFCAEELHPLRNINFKRKSATTLREMVEAGGTS